RLEHSNNAGQNAKHPRLRAVGDRLRRRWLRKETAITRPSQMRSEHGDLTLEPKHRAIDVWLPRKHADVVRQIAGGKIIRAIHDHVVVSHDLLGVFAREAALV